MIATAPNSLKLASKTRLYSVAPTPMTRSVRVSWNDSEMYQTTVSSTENRV